MHKIYLSCLRLWEINPFVQFWDVVYSPIHSFGHGVGEEPVLSKQSINGWLKALSLHANLLEKKMIQKQHGLNSESRPNNSV